MRRREGVREEGDGEGPPWVRVPPARMVFGPDWEERLTRRREDAKAEGERPGLLSRERFVTTLMGRRIPVQGATLGDRRVHRGVLPGFCRNAASIPQALLSAEMRSPVERPEIPPPSSNIHVAVAITAFSKAAQASGEA